MELSRNLRVDSIWRLTPGPVRSVNAMQTVRDAIQILQEHHTGCLLVLREERLVGIFTERDLLVRIMALSLPLSTPVAECMTPDPVTVEPTDTVHTAIERMQAGGYRHLPVVDKDRHPVGILSAKRIVSYLVDHFPATVYCLPPNPDDNYPSQPEGA